MDKTLVRCALPLLAAAFLASVGATVAYGQAAMPAAAGDDAAASDDRSDDAAAAGDLPVLAIIGVEVVRTSSNPNIDAVFVTGIVSSDGWEAPQLVPTYVGKPFDDVLDLELVATPPGQSQPAAGHVAVSAVLGLDPAHSFKGVRVRGAENAVFVDKLPGSAQAAARPFDCKDCLGKRFVAAGQPKTGDQGAVREEDLPKALRVIRPPDGIRGAEDNPNRLTLILGADDTIVRAFWE